MTVAGGDEGQTGAATPYAVPKGNGLGVAGFVCGLLGLILAIIPFIFIWASVPLAICGVVFGSIGMSRAKSDPQVPHGGLSIAGLVLGALSLIVTTLWILAVTAA